MAGYVQTSPVPLYAECGDDGEWHVEEEPSCVVPACSAVEDAFRLDENAAPICSDGTRVGSQCLIACVAGYDVVMAPTSAPTTVVCGADGQWSGQLTTTATCVERLCPARVPDLPANMVQLLDCLGSAVDQVGVSRGCEGERGGWG